MHPLFSASFLLLLVCLARAAHAQVPSGVPVANVSYTITSGNNDYTGQALSGSVRLGSQPVYLNLVLAQGSVDDAEVMNTYDIGLGWNVNKYWSLKTHFSKTEFEKVEVQGGGMSVGLNLHHLWQGKRQTRVEWGVDQNAYSSQSANAIADDRLPKQKRTTYELRQGLTDSLSVHASTEQYSYDRDPSLLGIVLLNGYLRKTNTDIAMAGMLQRVNTYRINWRADAKWVLDLSYKESWSVLQQRTYATSAGAAYAFAPKWTVAFGFSEAMAATLLRPNGKTLADEQTYSALDASIRWAFD